MIRVAVTVLSVLTICSCGLLGLYKDETNYDPAFQANAIKELNERPIGKSMDSLIARIDAAKLEFPSDFSRRPLILETFNYQEFLSVQETKFSTRVDNRRARRHFKQYEAAKNRGTLIRNPKFDIVYKRKDEYNMMDKETYPYVIRTTYRLEYDPGHLIVTTDGHVYPFVATVVYYIMDRRTNEVYGEIASLDDLSKP